MMTELCSLKETVEKHELLAKKSLGQNFLLDINITNKIIRTSLQLQKKESFSEEYVYEIGPGPGGLTRAILNANPKKLIVIEMDKRCIRIMEEIQEAIPNKLEIIEGDALKFDFITPPEKPKNIVSNLPYNISVPLLIMWLKNMKHFDSLTLMFQKEVAERICADTGNKNYGRISVLSQLICNIKHIMNLNPNCFVPAPKIWSSVLLFTPKKNIPSEDIVKKLEKITEMAFGQRRKMIRQSLKSLPNLDELLSLADIQPTDRAENISPEQFLIIAQNVNF